MISIIKKKNKIKRELLSKIEWACSLNAIKIEHEMIFEGCLRIIEHTNLAYVEPHRVIIKDKLFLFFNERDYPKEKGKTCRKQGAILYYNKRLQEKSAYTEYRKTYQQKFGIVNKNKDDKKLKKEFKTWKKQAKEKIIKLKHGELTEDEVYDWILKNK